MLIVLIIIALAGQGQTQSSTAEVQETRLPAYWAEVVRVDQAGLVIKPGPQPRTVPFDQLLRLRFKLADARISPQTLVELNDGSQVNCSQIASDGKQVKLTLVNGQEINLATRHVASCLLQPLDVTLARQWQSLTESRIAADTLILRRSAEALDKIEGIISAVSDTAVKFQFDGQTIDVQRTKLAGWRFFSANSDQRGKLLAVVRDSSGSSWMVQNLTAHWSSPSQSSSDLRADLQLVGGGKIELPAGAITDIDFSYGSMRFLADIQPLERKVEPRLALAVQLPEAEQLFGPGTSAAESSRGATVGPGIRFMGSGTVVYRVPDDFRRLMGSVALTPEGPQFVPCKAQVLVEEKVVWEKTLDQPHEVLPVELEVPAGKRVRLVVQSESKQPIGDMVTWRQLRFVK